VKRQRAKKTDWKRQRTISDDMENRSQVPRWIEWRMHDNQIVFSTSQSTHNFPECHGRQHLGSWSEMTVMAGASIKKIGLLRIRNFESTIDADFKKSQTSQGIELRFHGVNAKRVSADSLSTLKNTDAGERAQWGNQKT
jgi:hypothetical protein